jgi:5-methylcytosine-specific restriction protein A
MPRETPEWIGRTDDAGIPPRVRLRVFEAAKGICHSCGRQIQAGQKWQCDHVQALINGGENREANLAPIHDACHKDKTKADVKEKAKIASIRKRHLGIRYESKLKSKGFAKSEKAARREKRAEERQSLPPRCMFGLWGTGELATPGNGEGD